MIGEQYLRLDPINVHIMGMARAIRQGMSRVADINDGIYGV